MAVASFVFGLTSFGIGLVSLALPPFFVSPTTVVPLITFYGAAFALVMTIQLRRDAMFPQLASLLIGTVSGLVMREVVWLACLYIVPSALGVTAVIHLFNRIDQVRFRRLMFALPFALGLALSVRA